MKGSATVFASVLLLICGGVLLSGVSREAGGKKVEMLGTAVLQRQLGSAAVLAETTPLPSVRAAEPASTPEKVPVRVVEEAWDEIAREKEQETTAPEPVTLEGVGELDIRNETSYQVDLSELPGLPEMDETPVVLIMHTHGSESYRDPETTGYRTQDETKSVIAVGEAIGAVLEDAGITVIHDKTLCDYPEYTGAYNRSRTVIENNLLEHPEIDLVLDIHRDAVENTDGTQMRMACTLEGEEAAQLMLVVGTDAGGLEHPGWQTNLSLGAILQMRLTAQYPDLMRPLNLRTERFNQDLAPMTLLVEVGASGNSLSEAKLGAEAFAKALSGVLLG